VEILRPESLQITLELEAEGSLKINQEPGGLWLSEVDREKEGKFVTIHVRAKRHTGETVEAEIKKKLVLEKDKKEDHGASSSSEQKNDEHKDEKSAHKEENGASAEGELTEEPEDTNWFLVGWVTMVINLVIGIIGVLAFQFWKKRKAVQDAEDDKDVAL